MPEFVIHVDISFCCHFSTPLPWCIMVQTETEHRVITVLISLPRAANVLTNEPLIPLLLQNGESLTSVDNGGFCPNELQSLQVFHKVGGDWRTFSLGRFSQCRRNKSRAEFKYSQQSDSL